MGEFRDRMDQEMQIRGYGAETRKSYLRRVHDFPNPQLSTPLRKYGRGSLLEQSLFHSDRVAAGFSPRSGGSAG